MRNRFMKKVLASAFVMGLVLSQSVVSFANTAGIVDPVDYLFLTIFRACGVSPGDYVSCWTGLYKGYLRSIGDEVLLSRVEGYESLPWGGTAEGVDDVFKSVKNWLSLSDAYGSSQTVYNLVSSPSPWLEVLHEEEDSCVSVTPFPDISLDKTGYVYLFSQMHAYRNYIIKLHFFAPEGEVVVGCLTSRAPYRGSTIIQLYRYNPVTDVYRTYAPERLGYTIDYEGSFLNNISNIQANIYTDICSFMNLPFYVFANKEDMVAYLDTGIANNIFTDHSFTLSSLGKEYGLDPELQRKGIASIGDSMLLPASLEEAKVQAEALQKPLSREELLAVLNTNGLDTVYNASYKVEHYKECMPSPNDNETVLEKVSEEVFYGAPGETAKFELLDLAGYTYAPELTEPEDQVILADESLVVRLYYLLDRAFYTVEHYKENFVSSGEGKSWTLADTEALTGIIGTEAECPEKAYSGYAIDHSLTWPLDRLVLSDGSLVIQLYYTQAPFSTLTAPIKDAAALVLPGAAVIGCVVSIGLFLLKLYKRIVDKA